MLASKQLRPTQLSFNARKSCIGPISRCSCAPSHAKRLAAVRLYAAAGTKSSKPTPSTAKAAVEEGLQQFNERKDYSEAVRLFKAALDLKPNSEEAAAALFNMGCAYARMRKFKDAAEAIGTAINDHNLKLRVALQVGFAGMCW